MFALVIYTPYVQTWWQQNVHKHLLSAVFTVCSTLHSPAPITETALTWTSYSVPATSSAKSVEFGGGEPKRVVTLLQDVVPLLLYRTWYWEMVTSLWEGVQVTLRVTPDSIVLVTETPVTLEGAVRGILEWSILFTLLVGTPPYCNTLVSPANYTI